MTNNPIRQLTIKSQSIAEDLGYRSLADIATAAGPVNYRILGGLMVNLHAFLHPQLHLPPRATADADAGIDVIAVSDANTLADALEHLDYIKITGDRFTKGTGRNQQVVDILLSETADASRFASTGRIDGIQVPGLRHALLTPACLVAVTAHLTSGHQVVCTAPLPSLREALTIKLVAWSHRFKSTDEEDINRLLEIAAHTNTTISQIPSHVEQEAEQMLRKFWDTSKRVPRQRALACAYLSPT